MERRSPLGGPRAASLATAAAVFVCALALYLATLCPTVGPTDSGELTVAAWCLGNAHPPGTPLFLLLTHAVMWLPLGSVAFRANLASAIFSAAACAMLALAASELLAARRPRGASAPGAAAMTTGLVFATSRTLWAYATVTEVYAVNTALLATIYWLMAAWRRRAEGGGGGAPDPRRAVGWMYAAALVFGLALGVHHVTVGLNVLAFGALVAATSGLRFFKTRHLAIAAACALAGLLVYAYLPVAASRSPVMNWGNPNTAARVWHHVTGQQYRAYFASSAGETARQAGRAARYLAREWSPPWLPLVAAVALAGFVRLFRRDRPAFAFLALVVAADLGWILVYPVLNDQDAYLLPTFAAIVIAAGAGVEGLLLAARTTPARRAAVAAMVALPLIAGVSNWRYRDRSRFTVAEDYAENALRAMEPGALLLTGDWQLWAPMFYRIEADERRTDVVPIETGLLLRRWYFEHLERRYPDLVAGSRAAIDAYLPSVDRFEDHYDAWRGREDWRDEMNDRVDDLILSMIAEHLKHGPVYTTFDVALSAEPRDRNLVARLREAYDVVPCGVVVRLVPAGARYDAPDVRLETRGLADGTVLYDPDDVVPTEIVPVYAGAFELRSRYLAALGRRDEARAVLERAAAAGIPAGRHRPPAGSTGPR